MQNQCVVKSCSTPDCLDIYWHCSYCQWDYRRHNRFNCRAENSSFPNVPICRFCFMRHPEITFPLAQGFPERISPQAFEAYRREVSCWAQIYLELGWSREYLQPLAECGDEVEYILTTGEKRQHVQTGALAHAYQQLNISRVLLLKQLCLACPLPRPLLRLISGLTIP